MEKEFNEWMRKIKNDYYADNERMSNAFELLRNINKKENYENNN